MVELEKIYDTLMKHERELREYAFKLTEKKLRKDNTYFVQTPTELAESGLEANEAVIVEFNRLRDVLKKKYASDIMYGIEWDCINRARYFMEGLSQILTPARKESVMAEVVKYTPCAHTLREVVGVEVDPNLIDLKPGDSLTAGLRKVANMYRVLWELATK